MHIVLDARLYRRSTAGIGRYSRELIKELAAIDDHNHYTVLLTPDDAAEWATYSANFKKMVVPIKHFSLAEQFQLPGILDSLKPDLVHFLNFNHPLLYKGKFIATIHDLTMNFFPTGRQKLPILRQAYLMVMKHAAIAANAVIVPTQTVKDDVVRSYGALPQTIHVTYEGVEQPAGAVAKPKADYFKQIGITKPYILFVSQWRPHKGLGVLVEAFAKIRQQHDVQLVITGKANPSFPEIPALIEASSERAHIVTPGFVDDQMLEALYAGANLFVFPSWYEGFGLPPLEAMALGLPVAASNSSVMPEVLGDAAVYFDAHSANDMAQVISSTLANPGLLTQLRQKGPVQAKRYSWRKMAEETLAVYKKVVD